MRCRTPATLLVAVLALTGAACSGQKAPAADEVTMAGQTVTTAKLRTIATGLCDAIDLAAKDSSSSRATFYGVSHDGLHLIARGLQDINRSASAALLQAKEKVEADYLLAPPPAPKLITDLRQLAEVTRASLAIFKVNVDPCPTS